MIHCCLRKGVSKPWLSEVRTMKSTKKDQTKFEEVREYAVGTMVARHGERHNGARSRAHGRRASRLCNPDRQGAKVL